ncbi:hypothetical protein [Aureliella helgolandensis]|uniref:Uncharacterized protein n=1 Tax=Aureliella helgolandensis TaxID=2527968 RepID=A0A518G2N9_9BACT|nr:hypothetical protein [Aureliella helgolandensis]QDV22871.1 hypothetical protein Q31a_11640 [Aureliella helgolandensis]
MTATATAPATATRGTQRIRRQSADPVSTTILPEPDRVPDHEPAGLLESCWADLTSRQRVGFATDLELLAGSVPRSYGSGYFPWSSVADLWPLLPELVRRHMLSRILRESVDSVLASRVARVSAQTEAARLATLQLAVEECEVAQ